MSVFAPITDLTRLERRLVVSFGTLSLGTGMSVSVLAVYMVRQLHLSASALGVVMSVAALCGMVGGPVAGRVADRRDARRTYAGLVAVMSVATAALAFAGAWVAAGLLCVLMTSGRGSAAVMGGLVGREIPPERRVRYRAIVKTVSNAAMLVGLSIGGAVLGVDSLALFRVSFVVEAVTLALAALLVATAPRTAPVQPTSGVPEPDENDDAMPPAGRWAVLRNRGFLALAGVNAVVLLYSSIFSIAFPVWISVHAPSLLPLVAAVSMVNVVVVIVAQIPATRWITDVRSAVGMGRLAIAVIGVAVAAFAVIGRLGSPVVVAVVLLVLAVLIAVGEVLYSAASWELLYAVSPPDAIGEYQGVFNLGLDVSMLVAPMLFAWLAGGQVDIGWVILGMVFVGCALVLGTVVRRAGRDAVVRVT